MNSEDTEKIKRINAYLNSITKDDIWESSYDFYNFPSINQLNQLEGKNLKNYFLIFNHNMTLLYRLVHECDSKISDITKKYLTFHDKFASIEYIKSIESINERIDIEQSQINDIIRNITIEEDREDKIRGEKIAKYEERERRVGVIFAIFHTFIAWIFLFYINIRIFPISWVLFVPILAFVFLLSASLMLPEPKTEPTLSRKEREILQE